MNIKKQLKEERNKIDEKILSEGKETYNELVEQYCVAKSEQQPKRTSIGKSFAMASFVLVLCLVVGLSVALTQPLDPYDPSIPEYYYKNERSADCTFEEFYSATGGNIGFAQTDTLPSLTSVNRIYDSNTSDTLYYEIGFEHEQDSLNGNLYVIVNKYYEYPEKHLGEIIKGRSNHKDYMYAYSVKETVIEYVRIYEYFGFIVFNDNEIYFSFEESREILHNGDNGIDLPISVGWFFEQFLLLK